jgi:hypothetical protein
MLTALARTSTPLRMLALPSLENLISLWAPRASTGFAALTAARRRDLDDAVDRRCILEVEETQRKKTDNVGDTVLKAYEKFFTSNTLEAHVIKTSSKLSSKQFLALPSLIVHAIGVFVYIPLSSRSDVDSSRAFVLALFLFSICSKYRLYGLSHASCELRFFWDKLLSDNPCAARVENCTSQ